MAKRKTATKKRGGQKARDRTREVRRQRTRDKSIRRERRQTQKVRRSGRQRTTFRNTVAWRLIRGTTKGTYKGAVKYVPKAAKGTAQAVRRARETQRFEPDYEPEDGEIPARKFTVKSTYKCCDRRFKSPEALNRHHEREHTGEPVERAEQPRPSLFTSATARSAGTRTVKPVAGVPGGRHRSGKRNLTPAQALIDAHRAKFDEIGRKTMATDDTAAHYIKRGFTHLIDGPLGALSQIECDFLGMEQALNIGDEAIKDYRLKMINRGYTGDYLTKLSQMAEKLEDAAMQASAFIAELKSELAPEIAAAKARQAGRAPSDADLAG